MKMAKRKEVWFVVERRDDGSDRRATESEEIGGGRSYGLLS